MNKYIQSLDDRIRADNMRRYIEENFEGNVSAFARHIEFTPGQSRNLSASLKGSTPFGRDKASQIEVALKFPAGTLSKVNCKFPKLITDMVSLNIYQNDAAAGDDLPLLDDDHLMDQPMVLPRSYIIQHGANPKTTVGLIARGKSMQDKIKDGAIVFIDKSQTRLISGEMYCFVTNRCKRQIKYLVEGINGLIIKSENNTFPDGLIPFDSEDIEISIDGKVVFIFNPA